MGSGPVKGPWIGTSQRPALLKHPSLRTDASLARCGTLRNNFNFLREPNLSQAQDKGNLQAQAQFGPDERFHAWPVPVSPILTKGAVFVQDQCRALTGVPPFCPAWHIGQGSIVFFSPSSFMKITMIIFITHGCL